MGLRRYRKVVNTRRNRVKPSGSRCPRGLLDMWGYSCNVLKKKLVWISVSFLQLFFFFILHIGCENRNTNPIDYPNKNKYYSDHP